MFSPPPPFSPVSSAQLAVAALFGASVMAISAFYIHKRSVDQVLDRLINIRHRRHHHLLSDDEHCEFSDFDENSETDRNVILWTSRNKVLSSSEDHIKDGESDAVRDYRVSSSMPNYSILKNEHGGEEAGTAVYPTLPNSLDKIDSISSNLPPVRTGQRDGEEQYVNHSGTSMRVGSVGRLVTPGSACGYAFERTGDSDDEGTELEVEEDVLSYQNILPAQASNGIYIHVQDSEAIVTEAKPDTDHADSKVEITLANDPVFSNNTFPPITTLHDSISVEEQEVTRMIRECLDLRGKYVFRENVDPWAKSTEKTGLPEISSDPFNFVPVEASSHFFRMEDGVVRVYASERDTEELFPVASSTSFFTDMHHLLKVMSVGNVRSSCHHRLRFLEEKFRLHLLVNADKEFVAQKSAPHRDFYNIRKVDTHVHHSACMNQKHLLRFIKSKLKKEPDEVVIYRDGQYLTLKEVFDSLDLTGYDLSVDLLDVHADKSTFHRFDKFNLKYNPCGQSRLREIFLKQDNLIQGRFLADVTKQVLSDLEASKYQLAEYRISIYGRKQSEWDQLASWVVNNRIYSENAVWLIQLPRLYNIYRSMGTVTSFQNILDNIFIPLFEVTVDPNSHPHLHLFLLQVVGFDMVDDESKPERRPTKHMPTPSQWTNEFNPAFSYYAYYCYANLYTLNKLRESKGLPTIRFRPHCGEAGDVDHLAAGFLLCHNISHGINLRKSPVLQYLYYLAQIGLAMSPLSNNSLFLDYHRNPFPMFFQRGMNVSLSTDDPLQIHLTKEPLVEEYSVAAKVWKLSSCDLCEIARNSVYQSGFPHASKLHWLGDDYFKRGPKGNVIHKTNVPNIRIDFRHETWKAEMQYVYSGKAILPEEIEH
ncbi:AMP deaminase-like isoform X2 [Salvia miltiorrhiza]|uniref:AMP deaminase-like isoform X2 n=1 Tax=Salvia miltiorrhiza TaxID=226208 RepID=UPI0025ABDF1D|nr:AMP deaminase-like isoform X2 [Salvia miltiorrhiza]